MEFYTQVRENSNEEDKYLLTNSNRMSSNNIEHGFQTQLSSIKSQNKSSCFCLWVVQSNAHTVCRPNVPSKATLLHYNCSQACPSSQNVGQLWQHCQTIISTSSLCQ